MKGLNELNPSQRKNFTGLNDTIADDLNGVKSLENVIINFLVQKKKHYSIGALKEIFKNCVSSELYGAFRLPITLHIICFVRSQRS